MTKRRDTKSSNEEDAALFAREMAGVRPLPGPRPPQPAALLPTFSPTPPRQTSPGGPAAAASLREIECRPDAWGFLARDAGPDLLRELRAGRRGPAMTLDLHGMKAAQADRALVTFVTQAHLGGHRVLLVVHGRGRRSGANGPVLGELVRERVVNGALSPRVLAFSHAPAALGGVGASLLLLRKR